MRRLAQELDTGPASLYVYVADAAELHAAILDELVGSLDLAPPGESWRECLETVLTAYTDMLFEHPGLARSALSAHRSGTHYLRLIDALLALLDEGGVAPEQAAWGINMLLQFATATAAEQATRNESADAADEWNALGHAIRNSTHPHIASVAAQLVSGTPRQRLSWGFHVLINGISHTAIEPARSDS
jgi:AcrR family transcriptional regulator